MGTVFEGKEAVLGGEVELDSTHTRRNYLVDVENIGNLWMECILQEETVRVFLFFTNPSPHITYADLAGVTDVASVIKCFECKAGLHAVDFQLVSYLGHLLASATSSDEFIILSNDKGYDCVCEFWKKKGYCVWRMGVEKQPEAIKTEKVKTVSDHNAEDVDKHKRCVELIKNALPQNDRGATEEIYAILKHHKNSSLQPIYQALVKKYGQKQGLSHYTHIRAVIPRVQSLLKQ